MKKILLALVVLAVLAVAGAFLAGIFYFGALIKTGVEAVGPEVTKVDVQLAGANVSALSGQGELKGLFIGNPQGFKTPSAIKAESTAVSVDVRSLWSDRIVVKSIRLEAPEITFETDLKSSNLGKLVENVRASVNALTGGGTGGGTSQDASGGSRKIQVDAFVLKGAKVNVAATVLGGQSLSLTLPDIELKGLGSQGNGLSGAEFVKEVLTVVNQKTAEAAMDAIAQSGKAVVDTAVKQAKDALKKTGAEDVGKAAKGILDNFKFKK